MNVNTLAKAAIASLLALTTTMANATNAATTNKMEKCYGVTKAGMNDCQTATASCAGSATKDQQPDAFIFLPKGSCNKIVGGSTTPKK